MSSRASSVTTKTSGAAPAPVATPAAPAMTTHSTAMPPVPHDRIAMRAYEKWRQRGCPAGTAQQDWYEAEAELMAEMTKTKTGRKTGK